ncbi:MAG TPA: HAMP domain-containing sensor histidine kinase [Polyangiaceae bacterium]|nr:HAMP domain-containing sensor histidine kinase [Polyangiaceae bacterium]
MRRWHRYRPHAMHHVRSKLHVRLFLWIAGTIALTALLTSFVLGAYAAHHAPGPFPYRPPAPLVVVMMAFGLWVGSWLLARRLTRPLWELSRVAREIGEGKLHSRARLASEREDEVGRLARSINEMARRIERQMTDQKELLAAVSHELRTPLGHLRVIVELARERGITAEHLEKIDEEVREIDDLIDRLLASSRLDFSANNKTEIDAKRLLEQALERAGLNQVPVVVEGAPHFQGDLNLIRRALANLLDNAQRHGGGIAQVGVETSAERLEFYVCDRNGADSAKRFQQHWANRHRTEPASSSGLGLGLRLVERIANAHNGSVSVNALQEGARVAIAVALR